MDMPTVNDPTLEPHAVLPVQFHAAPATRPEKRLILAILKDALAIYRKYGRVPDRNHKRVFEETEQWLFSDDTSWPFSFVNLCHGLGIDVGWLRSQLRYADGKMTAAIEPLPLAS